MTSITTYISDRTSEFDVKAVPFELFLKNKEVMQFSQVLKHWSVKQTKNKKSKISKKDLFLLSNALDTLIEDTNEVLSFVPLDQESMKMSQELVENLQDTLALWADVAGEPLSGLQVTARTVGRQSD